MVKQRDIEIERMKDEINRLKHALEGLKNEARKIKKDNQSEKDETCEKYKRMKEAMIGTMNIGKINLEQDIEVFTNEILRRQTEKWKLKKQTRGRR